MPSNMGTVMLTRCRATDPWVSLALGEFMTHDPNTP